MTAGFTRSVGANPALLHAAAHSHHPWPDVSFDAQMAAWNDAARLLDRKWDHVFETAIPTAQHHIARELRLPRPADIAFAPNTHSLLLRILSCLPADRPLRILTTGSEFMSFARQVARLEEDGLAQVRRIAAEPFDSFAERFADAARAQTHDLVFLSHVFFDSGFVVPQLADIVRAVRHDESFVVVDGYHGFMAIPTDLSTIAERAFYLAGGYKYAMAGEGACFLHCPPNYGPRPRDTGWYAGFSALEDGTKGVAFAKDASRFLGATFDVSALYRFNAVQAWLAREGLSVAEMLEQVRKYERALLAALDRQKSAIDRSLLLVPDENKRGRFLAFRTERARAVADALARQNILVDHRADRLRIGFGIYHSDTAPERIAEAISALS